MNRRNKYMKVEGKLYYDTGYSAAIMSVGERTARLAEKSIRQHTDDVCVVKNVSPLYKALIETYQYGIRASKEWMILMGADTILDYNQTQMFLRSLKHYPEHVFCVSAFVQCKLRIVPRTGVYAYRINYLPEVLEAGKQCADSIRPQGDMHLIMTKNGYRHAKNRIVVGIHDYEQYHYDIFRTAHLLKEKWPAKYVEDCVKKWGRGKDFKTARLGLTQTVYNCNDCIPDVNRYDRESIQMYLKSKGVVEKRRLPENIKVETVLERCKFDKTYR